MKPAPLTLAIEKVTVGRRVAGKNPLREQVDDSLPEPEEATWRKLTLVMPKADGQRLDIVLLRPVDWIETHQAQAGATVELDLPELGAAGPAEVLAVDPCPPIAEGTGQVVTGTFAHRSSHQLLNITVTGEDKPIGVTDNHPFWSEDRQEFVEAGELKVGETLRTLNGITTITSITNRGPPEPVYNLEVHREHVYRVATSGVLVHNNYTRRQAFNKAKDRAGIPRSQQPSRQWTNGNDPTRRGHKNYNYTDDSAAQGRYYEYDTPQGKRVIAEHFNDPNRGPHFHAVQPKIDSSRRNVDYDE